MRFSVGSRFYFAIVNREARPMGEEVMAELCKVLRRGDVLILDECQRLASCAKGRGIEAVRELYDRSAASLVLLGNQALTRAGNLLDERLYGALQTRAQVFRSEFLHISEHDIDAFAAGHEVALGKSLRNRLVLAFTRGPNRLPRRTGGLRAVANLFANARDANAGELTAAAIMDYMDAAGL